MEDYIICLSDGSLSTTFTDAEGQPLCISTGTTRDAELLNEERDKISYHEWRRHVLNALKDKDKVHREFLNREDGLILPWLEREMERIGVQSRYLQRTKPDDSGSDDSGSDTESETSSRSDDSDSDESSSDDSDSDESSSDKGDKDIAIPEFNKELDDRYLDEICMQHELEEMVQDSGDDWI